MRSPEETNSGAEVVTMRSNDYVIAMRGEDVLVSTPAGLCCPAGGFYIDPVRPVDKALITHGHSDHARAGHGAVLAARYGETIAIDGVTVSFRPAGHVLGSAQIRVERDGMRVVASGDYKDVADPTCAPFELLACDVFITEATFGLPVFRHGDPAAETAKLLQSVALFPERAHLVGVYALGKAQRVMALIRAAGHEAPIYLHGALEPLTALYKSEGIDLGDTPKATAAKKSELAGRIVLAPPSATQDLWSRRLPDPVTAFASGWMRVRARARQKGVELPLVISDHADWDDLCATIAETGAGEVWVTHGQEDALVHWCRTRGLAARPLHMLGYGDEEEGGVAEAARLPAGPDETTVDAAGHTGDSSWIAQHG